jgi:hypothetical protein
MPAHRKPACARAHQASRKKADTQPISNPLRADATHIPVRESPIWIPASAAAQRNDMPTLKFATAVSFPFAGIGGPERAMLEAKWPFDAKNVIEKEKKLIPSLQTLEDYRFHRFGGTRKIIAAEDIHEMKGKRWYGLEPSQGFFSTSPCTNFSSMGDGTGLLGETGCLFDVQLEMAAEIYDTFGTLIWVCLEIPIGQHSIPRFGTR